MQNNKILTIDTVVKQLKKSAKPSKSNEIYQRAREVILPEIPNYNKAKDTLKNIFTVDTGLVGLHTYQPENKEPFSFIGALYTETGKAAMIIRTPDNLYGLEIEKQKHHGKGEKNHKRTFHYELSNIEDIFSNNYDPLTKRALGSIGIIISNNIL